jgi:predicted metal-dependent enzyme (double-stranded beta helix superfamily)
MKELQRICRDWSAAVEGLRGTELRMEFFTKELPALALNRRLFETVLDAWLTESAHAGLRQETLFENEFVLYRDSGRRFSLRLYIFGPGEHTVVHDHLSWGVFSSAFHALEVLGYRREDDGSNPDLARLALSKRTVLRPGDIETTLPMDRGIHRTGNPGAGVTLMVSIYGTPLRRLYIQRFHLEDGRVERLYLPQVRKKRLVEQALAAIQRNR